MTDPLSEEKVIVEEGEEEGGGGGGKEGKHTVKASKDNNIECELKCNQ